MADLEYLKMTSSRRFLYRTGRMLKKAPKAALRGAVEIPLRLKSGIRGLFDGVSELFYGFR